MIDTHAHIHDREVRRGSRGGHRARAHRRRRDDRLPSAATSPTRSVRSNARASTACTRRLASIRTKPRMRRPTSRRSLSRFCAIRAWSRSARPGSITTTITARATCSVACLREQLDLAREAGFPFIFHQRDAFEISSRSCASTGRRRCAASSTVSPAMRRRRRTLTQEFGLYLGIGGVLTFKTAEPLREAVRERRTALARPRDRLPLSRADSAPRRSQRAGIRRA